jgi:hypothetical protein
MMGSKLLLVDMRVRANNMPMPTAGLLSYCFANIWLNAL